MVEEKVLKKKKKSASYIVKWAGDGAAWWETLLPSLWRPVRTSLCTEDLKGHHKKSKNKTKKSPTAGDSTTADDAGLWKNLLRFFLVGAAAADASAYVSQRHPAAAERHSRA